MNNNFSLKVANQCFARKKYREALSIYKNICGKYPELKLVVEFNIKLAEDAISDEEYFINHEKMNKEKPSHVKRQAYSDILDNYYSFTKLPKQAQLLILKALELHEINTY